VIQTTSNDKFLYAGGCLCVCVEIVPFGRIPSREEDEVFSVLSFFIFH